ncbi:hypothetical protein PMAYCL1PPCAC_08863, partial [Pristionchus mayeri]
IETITNDQKGPGMLIDYEMERERKNIHTGFGGPPVDVGVDMMAPEANFLNSMDHTPIGRGTMTSGNLSLSQSSAPSSSSRMAAGSKTLNCRLCPLSDLNLGQFVNHLRKAHKTTPGQENLGFMCTSCNYIAYSYKNTYN